MQVVLLGLSITGKIICEKLLTSVHEVVVWSGSKEEIEELRVEKAEDVVNQKLIIIHSIEELRNYARKPRIILLSLESGEPTESMLSQLSPIVESGDVVIDCASSDYKNTQRHFEEFEKRGVKFLGGGFSGGIQAVENGFSIMVGGNADGYQYSLPIFETLAQPNGMHTYFGVGGAGHYVNMVMSGIESGIMQVIAEGVAVASRSDYQLNLVDSVNTWQAGSSISSFLLDMVIDSLNNDPTLSKFNGIIQDTHESALAVEQAKDKSISVPAIEQSVEFRKRSQYDKLTQETLVAKLVQAMLYEYKGE